MIPAISHAKQPLYLGRRASAELDEGPSLEVLSPGMVSCRFPLRRISRLIIGSGASVSSEGILACLKWHIPVTWCDRDGSALAVALPLDCRKEEWPERISMMMARPDWHSYYDAWVAAQRRIALRSLSARLNVPLDNLKRDERLDRLFHQYGLRGNWAGHLLSGWRGMLASLIVEYWRRLGIRPEMLISPADGWNLLHDMADFLVLDMVIELVRRKKRWNSFLSAPRSEIDFAMIRAFEARSPRLLRLTAATHSRFCRWLLDIEPWR